MQERRNDISEFNDEDGLMLRSILRCKDEIYPEMWWSGVKVCVVQEPFYFTSSLNKGWRRNSSWAEKKCLQNCQYHLLFRELASRKRNNGIIMKKITHWTTCATHKKIKPTTSGVTNFFLMWKFSISSLAKCQILLTRLTLHVGLKRQPLFRLISNSFNDLVSNNHLR